MAPEGVVNVLRRLERSLVPGGILLDLTSVPPAGRVEAGDEVLGRLDQRTFLTRAARTEAGLDELVREGLFSDESRLELDTLEHHASGPELVEDVAGRTHSRLPARLATRLADVARPVVVRERSLVRRLRARS